MRMRHQRDYCQWERIRLSTPVAGRRAGHPKNHHGGPPRCAAGHPWAAICTEHPWRQKGGRRQAVEDARNRLLPCDRHLPRCSHTCGCLAAHAPSLEAQAAATAAAKASRHSGWQVPGWKPGSRPSRGCGHMPEQLQRGHRRSTTARCSRCSRARSAPPLRHPPRRPTRRRPPRRPRPNCLAHRGRRARARRRRTRGRSRRAGTGVDPRVGRFVSGAAARAPGTGAGADTCNGRIRTAITARGDSWSRDIVAWWGGPRN